MSDNIVTHEDTIASIDTYLSRVSGRQIVPALEVQDLLLDLRLNMVELQEQFLPYMDATPSPEVIYAQSK